MNAIAVTVSKKFLRKHYSMPHGILKDWDKKENESVPFKLPTKPQQPFDYVLVNIDNEFRGYFYKDTVKKLTQKELEQEKWDEDFKPGWFAICNEKTWTRLPKSIPTETIRGFRYEVLESFLLK